MRKIWLIFACFLLTVPLWGQNAAIEGHSFLGGTPAVTSGQNSTNYLNGIIPSATITVYLTGTTTLATIYTDAAGDPLSNPFTSNALGSNNPGGYLFFAAVNQGYDVVMSGGIPPNTYANPVTRVDVFPSTQFVGGGCTTANCVITNPTATQTINQPVVDNRGTSLVLNLNSTEGGGQFAVNTDTASVSSCDVEFYNSKNPMSGDPFFCFGDNGVYIQGGDYSIPSGNDAQLFVSETPDGGYPGADLLEGGYATFDASLMLGDDLLNSSPVAEYSTLTDDNLILNSFGKLYAGGCLYTTTGTDICTPNNGPRASPYTYVNATAGSVSIPLGAAELNFSGNAGYRGNLSQIVWFEKTDASANPVTITAASGDSIAGYPSGYVLTAQNQWVQLMSDGQHTWSVLGVSNPVGSLTTTGTSGAATLIGGTLNIPQYQGALTLTTTGTSGAATLTGNTLNIPQYSSSGDGTVTSVAQSVPSWLAVSGSPITSSGTLAISAATGQTANEFLATPNGSTGAVGLRAIVPADIPTLNQNTTGNAATATALAATPTQCTGSEFSQGIAANGNANCATPSGGGGGTPGGSTGAVQYNNAGVFGGTNFTGLVYSNGSNAPAAPTIYQAGSTFYDSNASNFAMPSGAAVAPFGAGWPLPTTINDSLLIGTGAGQQLGDTTPQTFSNGSTTSGSTTVTASSGPNQAYPMVGDNIYGANIPLGSTIESITTGSTTTFVISQAATATATGETITTYPATVFSATATASSGSTTLTLNYAYPIQQYQIVTGAGIPSNDTVASISGTTLTLTAATTAALSSTPIIVSPGATSGLIALGNNACQSCVSNNGSVAIGIQAMANFRGDGTGGEDSNSVAIGPFAYSGCGSADTPPYTYSLFESTFIGNKVFATGCGALDSQFIGNHIYGFYNASATTMIGGEIGQQNAGVYVSPKNVIAIGKSDFSAYNTTQPPPGNYTPQNLVILGSLSGESLFSGNYVNILGGDSFNGNSGGLNSSTNDDVMGNYAAESCYSCNLDVMIGGGNSGEIAMTAGAATTMAESTIVGYGAYQSGNANTASVYGFDAGENATGAVSAFGIGACKNDTGNDVCIGPYAGSNITTGGGNVIIGMNNSSGDGPTGAVSNDTEIGNVSGVNSTASNDTFVGVASGKTTSTANSDVGYNEAIGDDEMLNSQVPGNQYDVFVGDQSTCSGCTSSISLGHAAEIIGAITGAVQIGTGSNSIANTMQFENWNFLTTAGAATFSSLTVNGNGVGVHTTVTVGTTAIAANSCTVATAVALSSATTSSTFVFTPTTDISSVTGWSPASTGQLYFDDWPTAGDLNYKVCNPTAVAITPSASTTWNVSVQ